MKLTKIFAVAGALALSSFAMAEGGGDRTFEKMMAAKDLAMEKYVAKQGKMPQWCQVTKRMRRLSKRSHAVWNQPAPRLLVAGFFAGLITYL